LGRLILSLPFLAANLCLPFLIPSEQVVARACASGQFAWWSNFKIIAFCCNRGPLVGLDLKAFALVLALPVSPLEKKSKRTPASRKPASASPGRSSQLAEFSRKVVAKGAGLAACVFVLKHNALNVSNYVTDFAEALGLYTLLGVLEDGLGAVSANVVGIEVEKSFENFFLSASLAEFWSLRWNQHVAKLLKCVVYEPLVERAWVRGEGKARQRGKPSALRRAVATAATFVASGVMHEVVFFYVAGVMTGGWWTFFSLQGVFVIIESLLRKHSVFAGLQVSRWVKVPFTLGFLLWTGEMHFFRPVRDHGVDKAVVDNLGSLLKL